LDGVTTKSSARAIPASRSTNDRTKTRIASESIIEKKDGEYE
jgi:hypothetical protein